MHPATSTPGAGLGLKPQHFDAALAADVEGLWFEVHPENYLVDGGPRLAWLERIGARHPLSLHGVAMSLGGTEPLDRPHLRRFRALVDRLRPVLVSEHLAWSRMGGRYLPDLLPVLRTDAALSRLAARVDEVQQTLGRRLAIENPSHYLRLDGHAWPEADFLAELVTRTGCGLLLDLNNVQVSCRNLGQDAWAYVDAFPAQAVMELHIAGHAPDPVRGEALLVDTHDRAVAPEVWTLLTQFLHRHGPRPVLLERDEDVPAFTDLMAERTRAQRCLDEAALPEVLA
ncbi:DUF692 domain-containing protein [Pseudacidovorax sp. RU35E]|uniref:MNIO family bufferin maturase n=1 Tax=Pseudacidovorax sp. RU35E TaxID=1907403 RepID=UPI0009560BF1|nr:DUF692 domain-containing protein [Pseudacidovorax sp. RU35E]SIQ52799.1 hypothetical protein SAMN05880557_104184 [Pseudacidovorax sp. RU35E]